jgi:aminoglycoside/choline kinase family phosphotransferase
MSEMQLFSEWFLQKNCNYELSRTESEKLQKTFTYLLNTALQQSRVTVHRDYHSRNLMARSNLPHGVIDFQDAVVGPVTYDLVSLLKDCYIKMDNNLRSDLIKYYRDLAMQESLLSADDINNFERYFDLMGVQRHLKAIGIFSRLYHRDGKQAYLSDIPRTASYITELENKYPELGDLVDLLNKVLPGLSLDGKH